MFILQYAGKYPTNWYKSLQFACDLWLEKHGEIVQIGEYSRILTNVSTKRRTTKQKVKRV
jgi:hypothetical protein